MRSAASMVRPLLAGLVLAAMLAATISTPSRAEAPAPAGQKTVTVFAAASLKNVLDATGKASEAKGQPKPVVSLAASSALAKQIEQGAPADVFISADEAWMDYLAEKKLIVPGTRRIVATNALVLIAPSSSTTAVELKPGMDLAALLGDGRLAVADVKAVPAGKYAKAALTHLGAWTGVESKLAQAENVRAALALVARGETPLGIVYASDAKADSNVRVVATFPADSHAAIVYPAAVVTSSASPEAARAFINGLISPEGQSVFAAQGFGPAN
jgi:molybdate transport system substrate-binding protein